MDVLISSIAVSYTHLGKGTLQKTILNRGLWGFYDDMEGFNYDVDRAKALMAEAGYPDGGIKTTLSYASGTPYEQIATVIQANLAAIGVEATLEPCLLYTS